MDIRQIIARLSLIGNMRASIAETRRFAAMVLKPSPKSLASGLLGISEMMAVHEAETATWISHHVIEDGGGGRFDTCDLRHWLAVAAKAGVPAIPAHEILRLSHEETSVASGPAQIPDEVATKMKANVRAALAELDITADNTKEEEAPEITRQVVMEKMADAADNLPPGWMVRHTRVGASSLKAIIGTGVGMREPPEVRFGPDLEVGPGWLRIGNRRVIDVLDHRIMSVGIAAGPDGDQVWLARPWVTTDRLLEAEDPHRAGSPMAGRGEWPAEWRVFIRGGEVIGVSSYYAWAGGQGPIDARMALRAAELGKLMADELKRLALVPAFAELEMARKAPEGSPRRLAIDEAFPRDGIACTLDFLEADGDLILLEGGPPYTPIGGAFPCAFAGTRDTIGVALRPMAGVHLGEPATWAETDRAGCILTWAEAKLLAAGLTASPMRGGNGP